MACLSCNSRNKSELNRTSDCCYAVARSVNFLRAVCPAQKGEDTMTLSITRGRLLAGAALGLGLTALAPQQAMAACVFSGPANSIKTCGTTTTTDTTGLGPTDRNTTYASDTLPIFLDVTAGALVDGFGLAQTDVGLGTNPLTITNNGTIQVNVGNTPTQGGSAALGVSSINTAINYSVASIPA